MSDIDSLIDNINVNGKNPNKNELWDFVKKSLVLIGEINSFYKELHEGTEEKESIIKNIEDSYNKIKDNYNDLFTPDSVGVTKSLEIQNKIKEIEDYHKELIDGENSIKTDIEDSQKHITDFYNFLFGEDEKEVKLKKSIQEIEDYYKKLTEGEESIKFDIERIYESFSTKYSELFEVENEGEESVIEQLEGQIKSVKEFNDKVNNEIIPGIEKQQDDLKVLNNDIEVKRKELNALLSDATAKTLAEGYIESMHEYSSGKKIKLKPWKWNILNNIYASFYNVIFRFSTTIFTYLIFMLPLVLIVYLFSQPDLMKNLIDTLSSSGTKPTISELIIFKGLIGLPLLWISWFGQKTISQRKRLFEEYNHKYRVVQMYLMFITNEKNYTLQQTEELENALLEVIKNNPAIHLGKGETMIDKIFEKFQVEGVYKKLKDEIKEDLKNLTK
ncbi:MAG: hypothetical protein PHS49_04040 [Candidatus Gracilibacteria bacterium]|nr:hypothetical protein [Candidatus Gracilibacteria bacterium]